MKCKEGSANWCFDKKNLLILVDDNFKGIVGENVTQYKVGDWVEIRNRCDGNTYQRQIDHIGCEIHIGYHRYDFSGESKIETLRHLSIVRKLKPSEVIVRIGCLEGTVDPVSNNGIHLWFHLIGVDDKTIATIRISCLDAPTRELVEGLLKAHEEE